MRRAGVVARVWSQKEAIPPGSRAHPRLEPMEVSEADAKKFKNEHDAKSDIWTGEGGERFVKLKKGSGILVSKALEFNRRVVGQIPTDWEASRCGMPDHTLGSRL